MAIIPSLNAYGTALTLAKSVTIDNAGAITQLGAAFSMLTPAQIANIAATNGLNQELLEEILVTADLDQEVIESVLSHYRAAIAKGTDAAATDTLTASTFSFTKALRGLGATMRANPIMTAVTAMAIIIPIVSAATSAYTKYVEEARQAASDAADAYEEQTGSLEDYKEEIISLRQELASGTLTEDEAYDAKARLLEIQRSLTESYGDLAAGIDLVNGGLDAQIGKLSALSTQEAKNFLYGDNKNTIDKALDAMQDNRTAYLTVGYEEFTDEQAQKIKEIAEQYKGLSAEITKAGSGISLLDLQFNGAAEQEADALQNLIVDLNELMETDPNFDSELIRNIVYEATDAKDAAQDILDDYQDIYDQAIMARLALDKNSSVLYTQYADAIITLNNALMDGNDAEIQAALQNYNAVKDAVSNDDLTDAEGISFTGIFDELGNTLDEASLKLYNFDQMLSGDLSASASTAKEALSGLSESRIKYVAEELSNSLANSDNQALWDLAQAAKDLGIISDYSSESIEYLIELLVGTSDAATGAVSSLEAINSVLPNLETVESAFTDLGEALGDFKEDGSVTAKTLNTLAKTFGEFSSFENYVNVLSNASSTTAEVQAATDALAAEYLHASNILDSLTEETVAVTEARLKEMGVTNAHEIVQERLNAINLEAQIAELGLADATWDEAEAKLKEAGATETAILSLQKYRMEAVNSKVATMDLVSASTASVSALLAEAKAAGYATNALTTLWEAKSYVDQHGTLPGETGAEYRERIESMAKKAQAELNSSYASFNWSVTLPNISVPTITSSSSSSSDPWKEEFEAYYNAHKHAVAMEQETLTDFYAWLDGQNGYKKYFANNAKYLDEFYQYSEEVFEGLRDLADDVITDGEHQIFLWENQGGHEGDIVKKYRELQAQVHETAESIRASMRSAGWSELEIENSEIIQSLQKQW